MKQNVSLTQICIVVQHSVYIYTCAHCAVNVQYNTKDNYTVCNTKLEILHTIVKAFV